jgi:hypothetical protein
MAPRRAEELLGVLPPHLQWLWPIRDGRARGRGPPSRAGIGSPDFGCGQAPSLTDRWQQRRRQRRREDPRPGARLREPREVFREMPQATIEAVDGIRCRERSQAQGAIAHDVDGEPSARSPPELLANGLGNDDPALAGHAGYGLHRRHITRDVRRRPTLAARGARRPDRRGGSAQAAGARRRQRFGSSSGVSPGAAAAHPSRGVSGRAALA